MDDIILHKIPENTKMECDMYLPLLTPETPAEVDGLYLQIEFH
jgi:hypothetical protein